MLPATLSTNNLVQGRLSAVNGVSPGADSTLDAQREARDEHKLTYRAGNIDGVAMVRGSWWPADYSGERALVVMEDREADQIGLPPPPVDTWIADPIVPSARNRRTNTSPSCR